MLPAATSLAPHFQPMPQLMLLIPPLYLATYASSEVEWGWLEAVRVVRAGREVPYALQWAFGSAWGPEGDTIHGLDARWSARGMAHTPNRVQISYATRIRASQAHHVMREPTGHCVIQPRRVYGRIDSNGRSNEPIGKDTVNCAPVGDTRQREVFLSKKREEEREVIREWKRSSRRVKRREAMQ
ncbi:hypothetical protein L1987_17591 [Smallanthus sonchifolius]|uniref:Uncharacterized protein n=1 Tax=Smallanthus sonchifolius TaxID=185202 RepID=A0ACB9IYW4_9ASTR|nr:hypothetical protein L1987_17591 [Smallanthus sonchifolius]